MKLLPSLVRRSPVGMTASITRRVAVVGTRTLKQHRAYGGTSGQSKGGSHGGQAPTDSNTGETGQTGPSSDNVANSGAAFNSDPDPKSGSKSVNQGLPANESMGPSSANPEMSRQFGSNSEGQSEATSTDGNTSNNKGAESRSSRGPGKDV